MRLYESILNFLSMFVDEVVLAGYLITVFVLGFVAYSIYKVGSIKFDDEDEL